ncbi:MAG: LicD family protein, partial [Synergistaceae bacterium]|nr:LicD family protein [Synergistaceae bacterium]
MRELNIQELRQVQLEILDVVAKFCDDNQIQYWLDAGTLLGAIRHKGYIPWDDDIDVGMLRP